MFPGSGQILDSLWYLLVIASISIATGHRCEGGCQPSRWAIAGLYALFCIIALLAAALSGYNTYLVHSAIRGIETAIDPRFQVAPAGASLAEQHAIATRSLIACLAWLGGVGSSVWGLHYPPRSSRARAAMAGVVGCCMAGAAGFAVWYFQIGRIELSVCWAEARFVSNWFDRLVATLVAAAALSWIAGSLSQTTSRRSPAQPLSLVDLSGKLLLVGAIATAAVDLGQLATAMLDLVNLLDSIGGGQWWDRVGWLVSFLCDAQVLLILAMLLTTARLVRARLRREPRYAAECNSRLALLLTLLFLVFAAIGAPTLAAFSLCAWLGPWYS
ncbi:hypothetical protein KOR34_35350 [Posidoniimonas corsicana]|uniref:Uncharacterized protein n=1 Tax=Posidoniimonas corsicana TaxID=1938618 RepID=A0A5C5V7J1_9BACT|nr:hypothetical protein KOR34_35350 [Posidoniimonas corsicana]